MSRTKRIDRPTAKKLSLRSSIVSAVDGQLADSLTGKPPYGAWTHVVEGLLNGWLDGTYDLPHYPINNVDLDDLLEES